MKSKNLIPSVLALLALCVVLTGCVAVPPLIQVQHKDNDENISRKLDDIDNRLKRLEQGMEKR